VMIMPTKYGHHVPPPQQATLLHWPDYKEGKTLCQAKNESFLIIE